MRDLMKSFVLRCLNIQKELNENLLAILNKIDVNNYLDTMKDSFSTLSQLYSVIIEAYDPYIEHQRFDRNYFSDILDYTIRKFRETDDEDKKKELAQEISVYKDKLETSENYFNSYMCDKWTLMDLKWLIELYVARVENRKPEIKYFLELAHFVTENFENTLFDDNSITIDGLDELRDSLIRKGILNSIDIAKQKNNVLLDSVAIKGFLSEHSFYRYLSQIVEYREGLAWMAISPYPESILRYLLRHVATNHAIQVLEIPLTNIKDLNILEDVKTIIKRTKNSKLAVEADLLSVLFEYSIVNGEIESALSFGEKAIELIKESKQEDESDLVKRMRVMYPLVRVEYLRRILAEIIERDDRKKAEETIETMKTLIKNIKKSGLSHDILSTIFAEKNLVDQIRYAIKESSEELLQILTDFDEEQRMKIESLLNETEQILESNGIMVLIRDRSLYTKFRDYVSKLVTFMIWVRKENAEEIIQRIKALLNIKRWAISYSMLQDRFFRDYLLQSLRVKVKHYLWLMDSANIYKSIGNKRFAKECEYIAKLALKDAFSSEAKSLFNISKMWVYRANRIRREFITYPITGESDADLVKNERLMKTYERFHQNAIKIFETLAELYNEAKISAEGTKDKTILKAISTLHRADALRLKAAKIDGFAEREAFIKNWNKAEGLYDKAGEHFNEAAALYASVVKLIRSGTIAQYANEMSELCRNFALFDWEQRKNVVDRNMPTFKEEEIVVKIYRQSP